MTELFDLVRLNRRGGCKVKTNSNTKTQQEAPPLPEFYYVT